jgi:hypothetical protein
MQPRRHRPSSPLPTLLALAGLLTAASCAVELGPPTHEGGYESGSPGEPIYVNESPPPPPEEVNIGVAPAPNYVWVGGYWTWGRKGWAWVPGRWTPRPCPESIWVSGHWDSHPRGYLWVSGQWR